MSKDGILQLARDTLTGEAPIDTTNQNALAMRVEVDGERIAALEAELARVTKEREEAMETRDFFANRLNEALGALGYEVPGDTPQGRYRCGMCGPKDAALLDAEHEWALWFEKWKAALDLMGSQADRANRAEQACKRTWERAIEAVCAHLDVAGA